jgi:hypothetical protein
VGTSLVTGGGANLVNDYDVALSISADAALGSTGHGNSTLPKLHATAELEAHAESVVRLYNGMPSKEDGQNMMYRKLFPTYLHGGLEVDRNEALERDWRVGAYGGFRLKSTGKDVFSPNGHFGVFVKAGASESQDEVLPFLVVGPEVSGAFCPFITKNKKHGFCLKGAAKGEVGFVEVGLDVDGGLEYRHKLAENSRMGKLINVVEVGAQAGSSMLADVEGTHNEGHAGLAVSLH